LALNKLKPNAWSAAVSPGGCLAAVGYENGGIELLSFPDLRSVGTLSGYSSRVQSISFSSDGRMLSAASWGDSVKVWDVKSREVLMTLRGQFTQTFSVDFSPDGKRLAVGGFGGGVSEPQVKLWDLATQRELLALPGGYWNIRFSPDGNTLAAMERGTLGRAHVWRAPSWKEIEAKE
jgi:WD40 repeat protein